MFINAYCQNKQDTSTVNAILEHIKKTYKENTSASVTEVNKAIAIANKINFRKGLISGYYTKGFLLRQLGDYDSSIFCYKKAMAICDTIKDWYKLSGIYNNLGNDYIKKGNQALALEYFQKSIAISQGKVDAIENAPTENNIGLIYSNLQQYSRALQYYQSALETFKKAHDDVGVAGTYTNIGGVYYYKNEYNKAVGYFKLSVEAYQRAGDSSGVWNSCTNLADIYSQLKQFKEAEAYLKRSYQQAERMQDAQGMVYVLFAIANVAEAQKDHAKSEEFYNKALALSIKTNSALNKEVAYLGLAKTQFEMGKYKDAYNNLFNHLTLKDTIHQQDAAEQVAEINAKYEDAEKSKKIALLKKENEIAILNKAEEDRKHKVMLYSLISAVIGVLLITSLVYARYTTKKKANVLLEKKNSDIEQQKALIENKNGELREKNKEITDGIHYAKRIQMALLTSEKYIAKHLKEFFVLYKPKDIVSGDFYWALKTDSHFYFTVADCTGHGVPGAFMSMIGINLLNDIISERKILNPSLILDIMREEVIRNLNSEDSEVESKDGMDMVLCKLNTETRELEFAAANNSLYIYHADEKVLKEYKGDKMPVGKYTEKFDSFTRQKIQLKENDMLYAFTDGYPDQFGGPKGKKYKYKQLEENIHSILHLPMDEQKQILNASFENWKGTLEQVDDVCIIGVRL